MRTLRELLTIPTTNLGRAARLFVFQYKFWSHCVRLLEKNRATQMAAALSYYTVFGLVPLIIMGVLIFRAVPAYRQTAEQLKIIVYAELRLTEIEYPDPEDPTRTIQLTDYLDHILDDFFVRFDAGSVGLISAVIVIWAALRLLSIIETAFNHMWYVARRRRFIHRIVNYWAVLTLGPLLLAVGVYATTRFTILQDIGPGVLAAMGPFISYLVSTLALFLLYLIMPNAKVRADAALLGAVVASLIWSFARWGFGVYVTQLIPYHTIYGVLGLIPLSVFWIYVTWVIVLFGLQLAFVIQHFEALETAEVPKGEEAEGRFIANDMTAIAIAREIAEAFESDRGPVPPDEICSRLDIPAEFGQKFLDELVKRGLLGRISEPNPGYVLLRDPAHIRLSEVADAVAGASLAQPNPETQEDLHQILREQRSILARHNLEELLNMPTTAGPEELQRSESPSTREIS